ncbi:HAD family hydrolase [Streptomyces sp. 3MP-14]|uniref:HAD family hydrolase n=1 Tax=Streptomyces mimosae TaxID=2586635 RepID=A0A5N6ARN9_9ACTN|nr:MULTISPECIES: HAD family hydrolase [Streptomyces]KAB8170835.1 HAD family hydrolase [Streptomyces mimosae]KAB8179813.1 HAD family hydrolase [Streptomyces sp. 3MP-14]
MTPARTLVASDLDRTLIYSANALELTCADRDAPRLLAVETYRGRPQSFVTEAAAALLARLAAHPAAVFVPTTTRTREQYLRVRLPGPAPRYAICANGGHLLVDGVSDPDWHRAVTRRLAAECAPLDAIRGRVRATADPEWLLRDRVAEDLFAYLVVDRERLPDAWPKALAEWAAPRGWTVSLQGRKLYVVPEPLTKSAAVAEVARRAGTERVLSAGDSLLDRDLLLAADAAWRPGHGELATSGWTAPHVTGLDERGVSCGESILRALLDALPDPAAPDAAGGPAPSAAPGAGRPAATPR